MHTIRSIDKDKNGFVTNQELEDILKMHYKSQLGKYDLKPLLNEFTDQASRLLVNYTKFRKAVVNALASMGIDGVASPGAYTDRRSSHVQGSSTLSPFMNGTNSAQLFDNNAAGVGSRKPKFTASDAVNGYKKFDSRLSGLGDLKTGKKIQIVSSHYTPR